MSDNNVVRNRSSVQLLIKADDDRTSSDAPAAADGITVAAANPLAAAGQSAAVTVARHALPPLTSPAPRAGAAADLPGWAGDVVASPAVSGTPTSASAHKPGAEAPTPVDTVTAEVTQSFSRGYSTTTTATAAIRKDHAAEHAAMFGTVWRPQSVHDFSSLFRSGNVQDSQKMLAEQMKIILEDYDEDRSGHLDLREFRGLYRKVFPSYPVDDKVDRIFREMDYDQSGGVETEEILGYLDMRLKSRREAEAQRPKTVKQIIWAIVGVDVIDWQGGGDMNKDEIFKFRLIEGMRFFSLVIILISVALQMAISVPELQNPDPLSIKGIGEPGNMATDIIEICCCAFFTLEFVLYTALFPWRRSRLLYVRTFDTWLNLVSIMPFYLGFVLAKSDLNVLIVFRSMRLFRLIRVLNMLKFASGRFSKMPDFSDALYTAIPSLLTVCVLIAITAILSASCIYFAETQLAIDTYFDFGRGQWMRNQTSLLSDAGKPVNFQSVPDALWWSFSVVYGTPDEWPMTSTGKVIAGLTMFWSILMMVGPVAILSSVFAFLADEASQQAEYRDFCQHFYEGLSIWVEDMIEVKRLNSASSVTLLERSAAAGVAAKNAAQQPTSIWSGRTQDKAKEDAQARIRRSVSFTGTKKIATPPLQARGGKDDPSPEVVPKAKESSGLAGISPKRNAPRLPEGSLQRAATMSCLKPPVRCSVVGRRKRKEAQALDERARDELEDMDDPYVENDQVVMVAVERLSQQAEAANDSLRRALLERLDALGAWHDRQSAAQLERDRRTEERLDMMEERLDAIITSTARIEESHRDMARLLTMSVSLSCNERTSGLPDRGCAPAVPSTPGPSTVRPGTVGIAAPSVPAPGSVRCSEDALLANGGSPESVPGPGLTDSNHGQQPLEAPACVPAPVAAAATTSRGAEPRDEEEAARKRRVAKERKDRKRHAPRSPPLAVVGRAEEEARMNDGESEGPPPADTATV